MSSGSRRSRNDPTPSEETSWEVAEILAEDGKRYSVRWAGKDPKTGKPWPLSWIPNSHCSPELIKEWERKKAKNESSRVASSSFESVQAPVAHSRPTDRGSLTKPSESHVPIRKRKHPSPGNTDDDPKPSKKRRPVTVIASQPGGDLGSAHHHTPNREDSLSHAPPHPPFEEIEMWVPTSTAKFGPPKRKHAAAKPRDPPKERRTDSIVSTATSMRTQAPLMQPVGLSESQIIALREEEEESQSQPHRSVSRRSPKLGSPGHDSAPNDPLQTSMGDAKGEAGEHSQEVLDDHLMNQLSTDNQPMDRNANTSHVSGLREEAHHVQDSATNPPIRRESEIPPTSTLPGPTRKPLVIPDVPAVIAPSTTSPLPEKQDPRPIANSTPSSVGQLGPLKDLSWRRGSGTLAERRASEARARLELVRRAAAYTTGNLVEGPSSTSIAPQTTTQPPPHVALQQVLNSLESPSQSQAAVLVNPKTRGDPPSEPREGGPSVESKDMVTQDKLDQHVNKGVANVSPHDNEPSPPDEVPPTTQSSTQTQSLRASSQASLSSQLAVALNLLHKKSEENSDLQAQVDALREQPTNSKVNPVANRGPFSAKGADHVATGVQTDQIREAQAAFDLERARWAEEKTALQSETDALRADKALALTDVEFFRAQYQKASAFTNITRSENEELLARATLAESQAVNGIAMIRATFEARVGKLESEARKYKALSEMLTERARRTDDDVRYRAAIAPELERQYHRLQRQLDEREGELDETKDELRAEKKVNSRLRRLVLRLEAEGQANGGKSPDREPPSDGNDDEDYVPDTSPSSSPPNENAGTEPQDQHAQPSNEEKLTIPTDQDVERLAGDDNARNGDMVYLCWWRSGEASCDAVVANKSDLHEHVLSHHLSCH
ncbi:hypothetical protein EI94DRAFT_1733639 [Lactarius quietus]|nr:hypothetical protein EI94DRAFT_1733639 [Lactarius quietus]